MKKLTALLFLFALAQPGPASAYDFRPDFTRVPDKTWFQLQPQQIIFNTPLATGQRNRDLGPDPLGPLFQSRGADLRIFFPYGSIGTSVGLTGYVDEDFDITWPVARTLNYEADIVFELGFDLHSQGKTPFRIDNYDTDLRVMWNCNRPITSGPCAGITRFRMYSGQLSTGIHYAEAFTPYAIVPGAVYHVHEQMTLGTGGGARIWIKAPGDLAEKLYLNIQGGLPHTNPASPFIVRFNPFFGGGGLAFSAIAAKKDSYMRLSNVHIYSQ